MALTEEEMEHPACAEVKAAVEEFGKSSEGQGYQLTLSFSLYIMLLTSFVCARVCT